MATNTAGRRLGEFDEAAQKNPQHRAIRKIARKIIALLGAMGLWVSATACGPAVVDLGARGGGVAASGADATEAKGGAGGASGDGAAGVGQIIGAGEAEAGAAAGGGGASGSEPIVANHAGAAAPPNAGIPGLRPDPSTGCGVQPPASDTSITTSGSTARYDIAVAPGYDPNKPYPLVFSFRGANVTIAAFSRTLDLPAAVGADGIVVNVDCANGAGMWDLQRDLPVFEALLAKLEASYCIDRRRVFVVGHETGAIFANLIACLHADVLRGLGSISGVKPQGMCTGGPAVWMSQGSADMTRALGRDNRDFWLQQNQCNATMSAPVEPSPCLEFTGCEVGRPVRYCEYAGNQNVPSFAAAAVWNFFKAL